MERTTLDDHVSSPWGKPLFVSEAKAGKTTFLIAQALGVWPGQKNGGVVDRPEHLHVLAFDVKAVKGVLSFLTKCAAAPAAIGKVDVVNLEDDVRKVTDRNVDWDYTLYNQTLNVVHTIQSEAAAKGGVHVMLISSLTGLAQAIQRSCFGRPGLDGKKGSGGDKAKWPAVSAQLGELRSKAQQDGIHCWWEGHIDKVATGQDEVKDSIGLQGAAGRTFAYNVSEVFRLRRFAGQRITGGGKVDTVVIDTAPSLSFFQGRDFHELKPQEVDMTSVFHRLGYKVGCWGRKK